MGASARTEGSYSRALFFLPRGRLPAPLALERRLAKRLRRRRVSYAFPERKHGLDED
jgi:hypothetical protein